MNWTAHYEKSDFKTTQIPTQKETTEEQFLENKKDKSYCRFLGSGSKVIEFDVFHFPSL